LRPNRFYTAFEETVMADTDRIAWLKHQASQGGIGRREFITLALAAGMTAASAGDLFAARRRRNGGSGGDVTATAAPPAAPTPKRGGDFKMATAAGNYKDTLDPATWRNAFSGAVAGAISNTLASVDAKNIPRPDLAESFEPADGARKWVFKLKSGVTFHNGKTLTADDVVATYNYHRDRKNKSIARANLSGIVDVKADGPNQVVFTLIEPHADFPYVSSDMHLAIFAAKDGLIDFADGAGTGPYIKDLFKPGVKFSAHRNPNYHKSDAAWFDTVEMQLIAEAPRRHNMVTAGTMHYIDQVNVNKAYELKQNRSVKVTDVAGFGHYVAPMNCGVAPFLDVKVRQAVKWAINRDEIVRRVRGGFGVAGNDNPLSPSMRYASQIVPKYGYDPDKAKALLRIAGYNGLKLNLSASEAAFPGALEAAAAMKASARRANIDITVINELAEGYHDLVWMKKPWSMTYWNGRATADWMFSTAYADDAPWNDSAWKYPKFNDLLKSARAELDDAKRAEKYTEMQQILHDDGGALVLMFDNYVSAHSTKVAHGDLNSNADHDGGKIFEKWWMV
jgi:peptide/nickel transport system substrate-binding protein